MSVARPAIQHVEVGGAPLPRYQPLLADAWPEFEAAMREAAVKLRGRRIWNVNSTSRGGGVAEMLAALVPYDRGAGIDERWAVIQGVPEFFEVTKKIHSLLHGAAPGAPELTAAERRVYEEVTEANGSALAELIQPRDVAVLHDPQTAGLVPALTSRGVRVVWRCHVGVDEPNDAARGAWRFLAPYLGTASAYVFSRREHVWDALAGGRVEIIPPCIDPFTTKNQDLDGDMVSEILRAMRIIAGSDGRAKFLRHEGGRGRVLRPADTGGAMLPSEARIVLQVSRWDRLKDPIGVLEGFAAHIAPRTEAWLVLAGPSVGGVADDPEQPGVLRSLIEARDRASEDVRGRIVIAQLPMDDPEENAAMVNALQRRADVVVQKSLGEGFGLTVAEAMWKARPVVASRVGGIADQIDDGVSGLLIDDPRDLSRFGDAVVGLLTDERLANDLGRRARLRVIEQFLAPRHLLQQARLIVSLLD